MGKPAAKAGDQIKAVDMHNVIMPNGTVVPQPFNFMGKLKKDSCIDTVKINGKLAAVVGSKGKNSPSHMPVQPGVSLQKPPNNEGEIKMGSQTVQIGGKAAARHGDMAQTCMDIPGPPAQVVVMGKSDVLIGG
ncbi:hypothetical protein MNBD_CHLOROFLEXI01-381 [hydrothermal vent metagenome]|uniref:Tox-PAAR-like domain-containing protein n=1 Tax=hydrothermal vent metagenome TaxID=652676 RepID=A0A3B0VV98_9ZZZZ